MDGLGGRGVAAGVHVGVDDQGYELLGVAGLVADQVLHRLGLGIGHPQHDYWGRSCRAAPGPALACSKESMSAQVTPRSAGSKNGPRCEGSRSTSSVPACRAADGDADQTRPWACPRPRSAPEAAGSSPCRGPHKQVDVLDAADELARVAEPEVLVQLEARPSTISAMRWSGSGFG